MLYHIVDFLISKKVMSKNSLTWSVDRYKELIKNIDIKGYDPTVCSICIRAVDNVIIDGWHRAAYLLKKYGQDYECIVVKVS